MKTILLFVAIALIALIAIAVLRSLRAPAQELSGDGQVIAQLKAAGSDLSRPHPMEFFLYFPNKAAADRASGRLSAQGFSVSVQSSEAGESRWLLLAKKDLVPAEATLLQIRQDFTALATAEGGEYDGWGSGIVR